MIKNHEQMEEIKELINYYITSKNVFGIKETLDSIVNLTTKDNFMQIIELKEFMQNKN